jgi:dihydrofolate reductase
MRKLIVDEWMSLDGVAQAPGTPDEDTSGGFRHGGWHLQYFDEPSQNFVLEGITGAGGFVLGRRTYEGFAAHWPNASEEEQVIARPLNTLPKYVASTTLQEPLQWQNSHLLRGDIADAIDALKKQDGKDLHVIGSTQLVQTLIEHDLVDQLRLMVYPVVAGGGQRLFDDVSDMKRLRLVGTRTVGDNLASLTYDLNGAAY